MAYFLYSNIVSFNCNYFSKLPENTLLKHVYKYKTNVLNIYSSTISELPYTNTPDKIRIIPSVISLNFRILRNDYILIFGKAFRRSPIKN